MKSVRGSAKDDDYTGDWRDGLTGIVKVNEDPDNRGRIKVVIPAISDEVCPKWINRLSSFVGPPGYGDFHIPEIGNEVALYSRLGQKHHLFYAPLYDEDRIVPADFRSPTVWGVRAPGDYKIIAELDQQIRAGRGIYEFDASLRITAPGGIFLNNQRY